MYVLFFTSRRENCKVQLVVPCLFVCELLLHCLL